MAIINDFIRGQFGNDAEQQVGIGGFTTMATVRERVVKTRDVPTTFLEDGSHINDHIIRNPLLITIEGNVSNTFVIPTAATELFQQGSSTLGAITQYAPARTQSELSKVASLATDITGALNALDQTIEGLQIPGLLGGDTQKDNIDKFIDTLEGILASDALIKIDTIGRTYENMAITSLEYDRDNTTNSINFKIEAQQFRFVETAFVEVEIAAANPASANKGQQEGTADKGPQSGEEADEEFTSFFGTILNL